MKPTPTNIAVLIASRVAGGVLVDALGRAISAWPLGDLDNLTFAALGALVGAAVALLFAIHR